MKNAAGVVNYFLFNKSLFYPLPAPAPIPQGAILLRLATNGASTTQVSCACWGGAGRGMRSVQRTQARARKTGRPRGNKFCRAGQGESVCAPRGPRPQGTADARHGHSTLHAHALPWPAVHALSGRVGRARDLHRHLLLSRQKKMGDEVGEWARAPHNDYPSPRPSFLSARPTMRPAAALEVALAVVAAPQLATPVAARSLAPASPAPPAVRVLAASSGGPPSASFSATYSALCTSPGVTSVSVSPLGRADFDAVAGGLYDGVLAEMRGGEGRGEKKGSARLAERGARTRFFVCRQGRRPTCRPAPPRLPTRQATPGQGFSHTGEEVWSGAHGVCVAGGQD